MPDKKVSQESAYLASYPDGSRAAHLLEINVPGDDSYKLPLEGSGSLETILDARYLNISEEAGILATAAADATAKGGAAIAAAADNTTAAVGAEATARGAGIAAEAAARIAGIAAEVVARDAAIAVETAARVAAVTGEATARGTAVAGEAAARDTAIAAAIAALPPAGGGGGAGDVPGPKLAAPWNGGKKNVWPLGNEYNGNGGGFGYLGTDYCTATPFVLSADRLIKRIVLRTLGNAGSVFRVGIYNADPDSYAPTSLLYGGAELDGSIGGASYFGYVGLNVLLEAGKVYWAAIWAGVADPQLYCRNGVTDTTAVHIIGSDHDDATTVYHGIKSYWPYVAGGMPANWPGDNGYQRIGGGSNSPLVFAGCE